MKRLSLFIQSTKTKSFIAVLVLFLSFVCVRLISTNPNCCNARPLEAAFSLIVLHTNDIHAHDLPYKDRGKIIGGMPKIRQLVNTIRKEHNNVLVVDAGDFFQGTPLFQRYGGEVEIESFNKIGYDIVALGNHEFDRGSPYLAEKLQQAKFPVLSCNIDCSKVPALEHIVKPSIVKEVKGEKIAFIGVITPDLEGKVLHLDGVKVEAPSGDWLEPVNHQIKYYRNQGINKIILVSHCGVELDKKLAEAFPDVDLIVGGHSHTRLNAPIWVEHNDGTYTAIVQTGCYARALGETELAFDQQGHLIKPLTHYHLINITNDIASDPELEKYLDEKEKPLLALHTEIVGYSDGIFENHFSNMSSDSAIGDLICNALAESGAKYGVQMAFQNRGGIRAKIDKGPITEEKIQELLPFGNKVVYATVSGGALLSVIEHSVDGPLYGSFLETYGLKVGYNPQRPMGNRIVYALTRDSSEQWIPIKRHVLYKIAVNDYTFKGGEGYDFSQATDVQYSDKTVAEMLHNYLLTHKHIKPIYGGRIRAIGAR